MSKPSVIFLDAVGTLFGVQGGVGQTYRDIARKYGVKTDPELLDQVFYECFVAAPPMAFPDAPAHELWALEYEWWQQVVEQTFRQAGFWERFEDFPKFFEAVYQHFAKADPWFVYPDVLDALQRWQADGITLGIISNFDSRLNLVLRELKLAHFFKSVTISSAVGIAKPEAGIFEAALKLHNCEPQAAVHIGDSETDDYHGARAAGLQAILVQRAEPTVAPAL
ncbi:MAG: HAD-IA family hydrolase [Cyanobacteria bacterium P01_H01_bin.121]